jgi:hypothetical protein
LALVTLRALITIVTQEAIGQRNATGPGQAGIVGAWVVVIAAIERAANANPALTRLA